MKTVPLGDFMLRRGGSVDPSKHTDETFEYYSIPDYDSGEPSITMGAAIGSSKKVVAGGDVLLSRIVPHIRRAWIVKPPTGLRQIGSGEWIVFRSEIFDSDYLKYFLTSEVFHRQFMRTVKGVGGSLLRADPRQTEKIQIPLPPLPEQRRIAARLDAADRLRRLDAELVAKYDELKRSLFLEMFGDLVVNERGWEVKQLGNLLKSGPTNGIYKHASHYGSGYPIVRIDSFNDSIVDFTLCKNVEVSSSELVKYRVQKNDLLINRVNSMSHLGKVGLTVDVPENAIYESNMMKISVLLNIIDPMFLLYQFRDRYLKKQIVEQARHSINQSSLNQGNVKSFAILVPSLDRQQSFSSRIALLDRQQELARAAQGKGEEIFLGVMGEVF